MDWGFWCRISSGALSLRYFEQERVLWSGKKQHHRNGIGEKVRDFLIRLVFSRSCFLGGGKLAHAEFRDCDWC